MILEGLDHRMISWLSTQHHNAIVKKMRGILNKLTPEKFNILIEQATALPINSYSELCDVVNLIYEKALNEPLFCRVYAQMCLILGSHYNVEMKENQRATFRKVLLNHCQAEFQLLHEKTPILVRSDTSENLEERNELQLLSAEEKRHRKLGILRFIGELFNLNMLSPHIIYYCLKKVTNWDDEESLECMCIFMKIIGKNLEKNKFPWKERKTLEDFFEKMAWLAKKQKGSQLSSRVRFMLQDVIELKERMWLPRRNDDNPKSLSQIQEEVEEEAACFRRKTRRRRQKSQNQL